MFKGLKVSTNNAKYGQTPHHYSLNVYTYELWNAGLLVMCIIISKIQRSALLKLILVIFLRMKHNHVVHYIRAEPVTRRLGSSSVHPSGSGGESSQPQESQQPLRGSALITVANFRTPCVFFFFLLRSHPLLYQSHSQCPLLQSAFAFLKEFSLQTQWKNKQTRSWTSSCSVHVVLPQISEQRPQRLICNTKVRGTKQPLNS